MRKRLYATFYAPRSTLSLDGVGTLGDNDETAWPPQPRWRSSSKQTNKGKQVVTPTQTFHAKNFERLRGTADMTEKVLKQNPHPNKDQTTNLISYFKIMDEAREGLLQQDSRDGVGAE